MITHEYFNDVYYKLLVTTDSIKGPFGQKIGSEIGSNDIDGQTAFSPDGNKFAMMNASNILDYMEFNRCNGEFFNLKSFTIPDSIGTYGCSFSPIVDFYTLLQSIIFISMILGIKKWFRM